MGVLVLSFVLSSLGLYSAEKGLLAQANLRKAGKLGSEVARNVFFVF